jgi:hypothetical protein
MSPTCLLELFIINLKVSPSPTFGLPPGATMLSTEDLMPLVSGIDRGLSGISLLLSYTGRLTLHNLVLFEIRWCNVLLEDPHTIHFEKGHMQFLWSEKVFIREANGWLAGIWYACWNAKEGLSFSISEYKTKPYRWKTFTNCIIIMTYLGST